VYNYYYFVGKRFYLYIVILKFNIIQKNFFSVEYVYFYSSSFQIEFDTNVDLCTFYVSSADPSESQIFHVTTNSY
jgi:hypothetical protein